MKKAIMLLLVITLTGCASVLPSSTTRSTSRWKSFDEAVKDYNTIQLQKTTDPDLKLLGFHPDTVPNVKILTYLDIENRFLSNPSIKRETLDKNVLAAIESKDKCKGYELDIVDVKSKRFGNVFADMTGFVKKTRETGWSCRILIILKDDVVLYKLMSGTPNMERYIDSNSPLGPLQDVGGLIIGVPSRF